ncbi:MAG: hypothetical protein ACM3ML_12410 [Micromonosporaceae bacterium]
MTRRTALMYERARQALASHGRLAALVAIAAAVALGSVALVLLSGGGTPQPAASKSPSALSAPAGSAASAPTTNGVPAGPPAAGMPLRPKNPHKVAEWKAGHGGVALADVTQQMGTVLMSHGLKQYPTMRQACAKLSSAVAAARAAAPIPDTTLETAYKRALATLARGAATCLAGVSIHQSGIEETAVHVNQTLVSRAVSELATGVKQLYHATEKIRTIKQS